MLIKKLSIIIIALVLLAAGFMLLRSFGLLKLVKNANLQEELPEAISPEIPADTDFEKYLIVSNVREKNSLKTKEQLKAVLEYMKKDYQAISIDQKVQDLSDFDCIFLTFERLDFLKNLSDYIDYVNAGGNLVFLTRPVTDESFKGISSLLGIRENLDEIIDTYGIKMLADVIIGAGDFKSDSDAFINSSLSLKLGPEARIFITSYEDVPILWEQNYGKGSFIVFNGTILNEKNNRGLIAGIIGLAKENLIYPIINLKMIHIDDFPAPIPSGRDEKIYEEFNRDIPQFYKEVWWTDMIKISKKFDIKYSSFIIESYNNDTEPPFPRGGSEDIQNLLFFGKELLGVGGELGLHGYNHQSLAMEGHIKQDLGYIDWKSEDDMAGSIKELVRFAKSVFSQYSFRAYVPPSNILSPEGRQAVIEGNPDLKIIASVYLPNKEGDV